MQMVVNIFLIKSHIICNNLINTYTNFFAECKYYGSIALIINRL